MRHEWTDPLTGIACAAEAIPDPLDGGLTEDDLRALEGKRLTVHGTAGRELVRLAARVKELETQPLTPFERLSADRLADEVAAMVSRGFLDSRSAAADALLDYREPPRTPRSDRIAELEELTGGEASNRYLVASLRTIREALKAAGLWRKRENGQGGTGDCAVEAIARIAALEAENRDLRERLGEGSVRRWAAVFGGGTTCPDGEYHTPAVGTVVCLRCDTTIRPDA